MWHQPPAVTIVLRCFGAAAHLQCTGTADESLQLVRTIRPHQIHEPPRPCMFECPHQYQIISSVVLDLARWLPHASFPAEP